MKSEFAKSWVSSKQPRKQRKYVYNAPNHIKKTFMAATLDKPLREKYSIRSIEVRKGDEVKIMRGKFAGNKGKINTVEVKNTRVAIDGIQSTKKDGAKVNVWFHPSNLKIITPETSDKKRFKKSSSEKTETKTEKKVE